MKLIFVLFAFGICSTIADEAPYPPSGWRPQQQFPQQQRALLILPPKFDDASASASQPIQDEAETLDKVSENVMERLRQEEGSDTGVYYVYLPDGRLQRVQYTTAPIKQEDAQPAQQQFATDYQPEYAGPPSYQYGAPTTNYQQQQQQQQPQQQPQSTNDFQQRSSQYRTNNQPARYPSANVQTNHQQVTGTNQNSFQGNQQQFNRKNQLEQFGESRQQAYRTQGQNQQNLNNRYQGQQQFGESRQQASYTGNQFQGNQYLVPSASQQQQPQFQQNDGNRQAENGDPSQILAQYNNPDRADNTQQPATSYLASVQFTDVPPITGPIFAYSPSPLVRIVRYANNYQ